MEKQQEPESIRKERIRMAKAMVTKTSKNPKAYDRNESKNSLKSSKYDI